jgi:hypothetical protein
MRRATRWVLAFALVAALAGRAAADEILDQFDDISGWTATASPGTTVTIVPDAGHTGGALRIDFDFHGGGGYVLVHKAFPLALPDNFAFKLDVRGTAPPNTLEFKILDGSGNNVWWSRRRDFTFPEDWQQLVVKRSRFRFAWGPAGGGWPHDASALEIAITPGSGGAGSVWLDDLRLEAREPVETDGWRPKVTASTTAVGHDAALAVDDDQATGWRSDGEGPQWVLLDLLKHRELGGLVIDWDPEAYATRYRIEVSDDAQTWIAAYTNTTGSGRRDYIYMPDAEWRYVRLNLDESNAGGFGIREIVVKSPAFSESVNDFFAAIASDAPPGTFPKYLLGKQTYWTVIGNQGGDGKKAIMNEEGAIEVDVRAFSLEPFLYANGSLVTWSDAQISQQLVNGALPIPSATWKHDNLVLHTQAWAAGAQGASMLYVRYRVENAGDAPTDARLYVALRPFQVLPPWQSLNILGGVSPIHVLDFDGRTVLLDGERTVTSLTPPARFGAASFAQNLTTNFLRRGELPTEARITDTFGYASGAFEYPMSIPAGGGMEVHLAVPLHERRTVPPEPTPDPGQFETTYQRTVTQWTARLGRVDFQLPPTAKKLDEALQSSIAYMLVNADGAALRPGSRTYARSWIRDGAMESATLLETGSTEEARAFIAWFAQFQMPDGRIPCCIDRHGADAVAEYDSDGEFIYAIAEYYRYTHDVGFVQQMWPSVTRALDSINALRARRLTEEYSRPEKEMFRGLLPESISHEGYSSHPVHSYWDDFFGLRGLSDGAMLAAVVGDDERGTATAGQRDQFRTDLYASIAKAMAHHHIDYIPGSAELGDFDPTSTAIAVTACNEIDHLPTDALIRTFDRYWENRESYMHGVGDAYSPYELRNVEVLVRLGQRERANELLRDIVADLRPLPWNSWQEVVWRDAAAPRFIGDMPHTWVAAGYVQSVRAMFAYEREDSRTLVLAAGVPWDWVASETGVGVKRLPTHYGTLGYTLKLDEPGKVRMKVSGDVNVPPTTVVLAPPLPAPLKGVTVNGKEVTGFETGRVALTTLPADVVLQY